MTFRSHSLNIPKTTIPRIWLWWAFVVGGATAVLGAHVVETVTLPGVICMCLGASVFAGAFGALCDEERE